MNYDGKSIKELDLDPQPWMTFLLTTKKTFSCLNYICEACSLLNANSHFRPKSRKITGLTLTFEIEMTFLLVLAETTCL